MIVTWRPERWESERRKPLEQRLGPASAEVIDYIRQVNAATGIAGRAETVDVDQSLLDDVCQALIELPEAVRHLLEGPLLGVRFARGLGSSGVTDVVARATGGIVGMVTVLDIDTLVDRTANQWAGWKENSPFDLPAGLSLEARIESAEGDNRKNAIQYILLHEFGHVLTADSALLPNWWLNPQGFKTAEEYGFLRVSWDISAEKRITALPRDDFALRERIAFYGGPKLSGDAAEQAYAALGGTRFATLYGACNAYDDFAEAFASYVHAVIMGRPLEICLRRDGEVVWRADDFWRSERGAQKRALLENFLAVRP